MSSWPLSHDPTTCSVKTGSFCVAPVWGLGVGFQPNHLWEVPVEETDLFPLREVCHTLQEAL